MKPKTMDSFLTADGFIDINRIKDEKLVQNFFPGLLPEVEEIRKKDFPELYETERVYLDNGATTLEAKSVRKEYEKWRNNRTRGSNHSWFNKEAREAQGDFLDSKGIIRDFLGAKNYYVALTSGTTEGSVALALRFDYKPSDLVIISEMEHNSQILPIRKFTRKLGIDMVYAPITPTGTLDLNALESIVGKSKHERILMNLVHTSNVTGVTNPVNDIKKILGERGIIYLDIAQSTAHTPINLDELGVDFAGLSAHKVYGPMGVGALLIKKSSDKYLNNSILAGGAVDFVTPEFEVPVMSPERFELGTKNLEGAHEFALALKWLSKIGVSRVQAHEKELGKYFTKELAKINGVQILGHDPERSTGITTFNVGSHARMMHGRVAQRLNDDGIAVRNGCFCSHIYTAQLTDTVQYSEVRLQEYFEKYAPGPGDFIVPGGVRVAFGAYNTLEEASKTIQSIRKIAKDMTERPVSAEMAWISHINDIQWKKNDLLFFRDRIDPRDIECIADSGSSNPKKYSTMALYPVTLTKESMNLDTRVNPSYLANPSEKMPDAISYPQYGTGTNQFKAFKAGFNNHSRPNSCIGAYNAGKKMKAEARERHGKI